MTIHYCITITSTPNRLNHKNKLNHTSKKKREFR